MNVLVGTNGKPNAERAVEFALNFARALGANLYAMYVVDPKSGEEKDKNIKNGMRVLGRTKIRAADLGIAVATLLEAGEPHDTILSAADQLDADAIIVGNSERSGIGARLLGASVSELVFKDAKCTVIVVR
jgi:nucleotide-binding universal stress UspA family protein